MSFPLSPTDGQGYINSLGTRYVYNAADNKWVIQSQDIGVTGLQGATGAQGATGISGIWDNGLTGCLNCTIDGRGYPITTGFKGDIVIPANIRVFRWDLFGDTGGSVMLNVKKATYSSYPGSTAMHLGATGPSLILSTKNQITSISGWGSPTGAAGDIIRVEVASCTGVHRLSLNLGYALI